MSTDIVPREKLTKQGITGVVSAVGGVASLIFASITASVAGGIIVGGIVTVAGLLLSGTKHEKTAGVITTVVGAATLAGSLPVLRGIFEPLVHGVLVAGGIVLLGVGVYSLVKFFRGLKSRA